MKTLIEQGAEASVYRDGDIIIKERPKKSYRNVILDEKLRKFRTKREAKVLTKAHELIHSPKLIASDQYTITMQYIDGKKVKEVLESTIDLSTEIGKQLAILHDADIIHGDLTTSNMLYHDNKVYFIDFGLSFFSKKLEDKATDLKLLKQALDSKHHTIADEAFELVLKGYKKSKHAKDVLDRLLEVEKRGRNKH